MLLCTERQGQRVLALAYTRIGAMVSTCRFGDLGCTKWCFLFVGDSWPHLSLYCPGLSWRREQANWQHQWLIIWAGCYIYIIHIQMIGCHSEHDWVWSIYKYRLATCRMYISWLPMCGNFDLFRLVCCSFPLQTAAVDTSDLGNKPREEVESHLTFAGFIAFKWDLAET